MRSRTLERYIARQIVAATALVLVGFLGLFAFFDLIGELGDLGKGHYDLPQIFRFVVLSIPSHAYELSPVVVLIGTLYVLAHLASNSEFTVMRSAGLSPRQAWAILARIGLVFVVGIFVLGEWIAPAAEEAATQGRMRAMSSLIGRDMSSGLWFRDEQAFVNVREARRATDLEGVRIYQFDNSYRLRMLEAARRAVYRGDGLWTLSGVEQTRFTPEGPRVAAYDTIEWHTAVTPDLINVLVAVPEHMSVWALYKYTEHLAGNRQKTERYDIAMWKKIFYPFAALVMMALALPFGYLHARSGMVGVKVFLGIMLGIFFHVLNSLFAHVGLLQDWPPVTVAAVPSAAFFLAAIAMMWAVERR